MVSHEPYLRRRHHQTSNAIALGNDSVVAKPEVSAMACAVNLHGAAAAAWGSASGAALSPRGVAAARGKASEGGRLEVSAKACAASPRDAVVASGSAFGAAKTGALARACAWSLRGGAGASESGGATCYGEEAAPCPEPKAGHDQNSSSEVA
mmetsp:Transcript_87173/g.244597  ORF Transcript_87173/g.244597 Transcript_87173/m.244597 type:complete len:152 (+) Transcript_87173:405-860(+)